MSTYVTLVYSYFSVFDLALTDTFFYEASTFLEEEIRSLNAWLLSSFSW